MWYFSHFRFINYPLPKRKLRYFFKFFLRLKQASWNVDWWYSACSFRNKDVWIPNKIDAICSLIIWDSFGSERGFSMTKISELLSLMYNEQSAKKNYTGNWIIIPKTFQFCWICFLKVFLSIRNLLFMKRSEFFQKFQQKLKRLSCFVRVEKTESSNNQKCSAKRT